MADDQAIDTGENPYLRFMPPEVVQGDQPAPAGPTTAAPGPTQAVPTDRWQPPTPKLGTATPGVRPEAQPLPFDDDQMYGQSNVDITTRRNTPVSSLRGERVTPPQTFDYRTDPRWAEAQSIRADIAKNLDRRSAAQPLAQLKIQEDRLIREYHEKQQAENRRAEQQRQADARNSSARFQDQKARQESANISTQTLSGLYQMYSEQGAADPNDIDPKTGKPKNVDAADPKKRWDRDYTRNASPLGTMKPQEVRDAVTNVAMKNGHISNEQAAAFVLGIGSPIELRPEVIKQKFGKDDPHIEGKNGLKGKGGTNYQVVGHDPYTKDYVLEMPDGTQIRIDGPTFNRLRQAQAQGYTVAREMILRRQQAEFDAKQPDWLERTARPVIDFTNKHIVDPIMGR